MLVEVFATCSFTAAHQACGGDEHVDIFRVELRARGSIGHDGVVVSFDVLQAELDAIRGRWELGRVVIPGGNETAERVAAYLFEDIRSRVPDLHAVVWWDGTRGAEVRNAD